MTTNRVAILRESVKRIVQILAERDIRVHQQGSRAYVEYGPDGVPVAVFIPFIPDNAPDELLAAVQGFIDHEVGHLLNSDFALMAKHAKGPLGNLHNMIEDTYVERKMRERFAGCAHNFRVIYETYVTRIIGDALKKAKTPEERISALLGSAVRAWAGQDFFVEYMKDKWELIEGLTKKMPATLADEIARANSTADTLEAARKLYKAMHDDEPKQQDNKKGDEKGEPQEGDDGESSDSGDSPGKKSDKGKKDKKGGKKDKGDAEKSKDEKSDADGEGSEEGSDADGEDDDRDEEGDEGSGDADGEGEGADGDGEDEEGSASGESESGDDEEEGDDEGEGDDGESEGEEVESDALQLGGAVDAAQDFSDALTQWISETTVDLQKDADYVLFTTDYDKVEPLMVGDEFNMREVERMEDAVLHMVGPIQKDLERAIVANSRSFWQPGRRSGKLHGANLSRLKFNDDRVFRSKEEHTCKDTAISLVIDCSGSMNGEKIRIASRAAYALSQTLDRMHIAHEVIGFTTYWNDDLTKRWSELQEAARKLKRSMFSRQDAMMMPVVKGFDERITTEHKKRFAYLASARNSNQLFGNNIDGESIEIAARRLAARREARKVMIVLSDGAPAAHGDSREIQRHAKSVIEKIERANGMEIVGIGIMSNAVRQFYTRNMVLNDVGELPAVVMGELKHALLHG